MLDFNRTFTECCSLNECPMNIVQVPSIFLVVGREGRKYFSFIIIYVTSRTVTLEVTLIWAMLKCSQFFGIVLAVTNKFKNSRVRNLWAIFIISFRGYWPAIPDLKSLTFYKVYTNCKIISQSSSDELRTCYKKTLFLYHFEKILFLKHYLLMDACQKTLTNFIRNSNTKVAIVSRA